MKKTDQHRPVEGTSPPGSPSRNVVTPSGGHLRGWFTSFHFGNVQIQWEGDTEQPFLFCVEFSNYVLGVESQPDPIAAEHEGKIIKYTADFRLRLAIRHIRVECKPEARVKEPSYQARLAAITPAVEKAGDGFKVVTRQQLEASNQLENAKDLLPYRLRPMQPIVAFDTALRNAKIIAALAPLSYTEAVKAVGSDDAVKVVLAERLVHFDFRQRLGAETLLFADPLEEACDAAAVVLS